MQISSTSSGIYFINTLDVAMLDAFQDQAASVPAVTFDIETTALSPIDHQISLIGIGVPAKSGFQGWIFDIQAEAQLSAKLKDILLWEFQLLESNKLFRRTNEFRFKSIFERRLLCF